MRPRRPILFLVIGLLALACRAPVSTTQATPPWPRDARSAWIAVTTTGGTGTRVFDPERLGTVPAEAHPALFFGPRDQDLFAYGLREELARAGAFPRVAIFQERGAEEVVIHLAFGATRHEDDHTYTLEVTLDIQGSPRPLHRDYRVVSSEGDSWWRRMTTDAFQGKQRAHRRLMDQVLADIRLWLAQA